jgi:hypothetical protein
MNPTLHELSAGKCERNEKKREGWLPGFTERETDSCLLFAQYNETSRPLNIYHRHQPSSSYSSTSFVNVSKEEKKKEDGA